MKFKLGQVSLDLPDRHSDEDDITEKQIRFLEHLGVDINRQVTRLSKWQASALLDHLLESKHQNHSFESTSLDSSIAPPKKQKSSSSFGCTTVLILGLVFFFFKMCSTPSSPPTSATKVETTQKQSTPPPSPSPTPPKIETPRTKPLSPPPSAPLSELLLQQPAPVTTPKPTAIPTTAQITTDVFIPIEKDGRRLGEFGILAGTRVKILAFKPGAEKMKVEYRGKPVIIPVKNTDLSGGSFVEGSVL